MTEYSSKIKLSPKQITWLDNVPKYRYSCCKGAAQCGKSVLEALAASLLIEASKPDENLFLVIGYSASSGYNNIGICNGFGIKYYFGSRCTQAKYQGNLALRLNINGLTKYVLFFGAGNVSSANLYHGYSTSLVVCDEADRFAESSRTEILERVQAHPDGHILYASNSTNPNNAYTKFINGLIEKHAINFVRFSLYDNPVLTKDNIERIISHYDPHSIFYKMYVDGIDCSADGAAFTVFDYNLIDAPRSNYSRLYVVADTGETKSATGIIVAGMYYDKGNYYADIIGEYYWLNADHPYNPKRFPDTAKDIADFVKLYTKQLNHFPDNIIIDESPELYKNVLDAFRIAGLPTSAIKYPIKDTDEERVKRIETLLYMNRLHVCKNCKHTISALQNATFDTKSMDKNGTIKLSDDYNSEGHSDLLDCVSYLTKWINPLF